MRCVHYTEFRQRNLPTVFAIFARFLSMCPHKRFMRGRRKLRQKPPPIKKAVRRTSAFAAPLPKGPALCGSYGKGKYRFLTPYVAKERSLPEKVLRKGGGLNANVKTAV